MSMLRNITNGLIPLALSTSECTASESIPAVPETNAPANFDAVIIKFVAIAATIALGFQLNGYPDAAVLRV